MAGLTDLLGNTLLAVKDLQSGELVSPAVHKERLEPLCKVNPSKSVWNVIGDKLVLHKLCFVCVAVNDKSNCLEELTLLQAKLVNFSALFVLYNLPKP